uniref:Uncharacterized protein n=1 Tax=Pyrodinium bahamense TaxID=73915 RepID=A0A7S0AAR1_9DINO
MNGPEPLTRVDCILGLPCALTVTGHNLADTNSIMVTSILDTCGQASLRVASFEGMPNPAPVEDGAPWDEYDLGTPTNGLPGEYAVCWSHHGGSHSAYKVRVATLRMGGPAPADRECTLSEPCRVSLTGVRLAHSSKILLVSKTSTCGDASPTLGSWLGVINPAGTALLLPPVNPGFNYSNDDTYDLGLGYGNPPSTTFQMCWAFDPTAGGGASDYKTRVGQFMMNGPNQDLRIACTMGQPCNVELAGVGLAATNWIKIVAGYGACGSSGVTEAVLSGIENPRLVTDDKYDNLYNMGMVIVGGAYSVCRVATPASSCIGSHYRLCWAHGVTTTADGEPNFVVEIGTFALSGPFVTYSVECTLGIVCVFQIYGTGFQRSNGILIIQEGGACGDEQPPVASFAGLQNPTPVAEVSNDTSEATFRLGRSHSGQVGAYRVCWGFDPRVPRHYNIEVGPFSFRALPSDCSVEDAFTLQCAGSAG